MFGKTPGRRNRLEASGAASLLRTAPYRRFGRFGADFPTTWRAQPNATSKKRLVRRNGGVPTAAYGPRVLRGGGLRISSTYNRCMRSTDSGRNSKKPVLFTGHANRRFRATMSRNAEIGVYFYESTWGNLRSKARLPQIGAINAVHHCPPRHNAHER